ncbi:MAG TPA: alpha/beta fold hydrolase [Streptosporangiaceae bacterium]|jgi:pimeloyl-ACP methyl ester carboxylesterase
MTDPVPVWPGKLASYGTGEVFVRAAPALPGAEPAMLVHGLGGSSTNWTDLMDLLRQQPPAGQPWPALACEALDLPGFGFSPPRDDEDYSIDALAATVAGLIEKRGNWPVHLIGNSLGGAVCTRVAARRPDLVRTLTLISPALPDLRPRLLPLRVTLLSSPALGPWLVTRSQRASAQARSELMLKGIYFDPQSRHPQRRIEDIAELSRRDQVDYANRVLVRAARGLVVEYMRPGARSLWRDAARVAGPALIIHGSHDRLVNPLLAARAARVFSRSRVVVLPRTGHVAMMERPAWVAREIRSLLAVAPSGLPGGRQAG